MRNWWPIISFWLVISTGCDPCRDCGEPLRYDPTVTVRFINEDSATHLEDNIAQNQTQIEENTALIRNRNNSIGLIEDSLAVIDSLVAAGNSEYIDEQLQLNDSLQKLETSVDSIDSESARLSQINTRLSGIRSTILSGRVFIDRLLVPETSGSITYEDSMSAYSFPLLMNQEETTYLITIDGTDYSVVLNYEQSAFVNDAREVRIIMRNIRTASYTFDSLDIDCSNSECLSNETSITFYF